MPTPSTTRGWLRFWLGDATGALSDGREALNHAASAGSPGLQAEAAALVASSMRWGPTRWSELLEFVEERLENSPGAGGGRLGASPIENRCAAETATGLFDKARVQFEEFEQSLRDRGMQLFLHTLAMTSGPLELRAREYGAAERNLRPAWNGLATSGESGFRATIGVMLAEALVGQRRSDEAAAVLAETEGLVAADDVVTVAGIRTVRSMIATEQGRAEEAIVYAREAVALCDATDYLEPRIEARMALGRALRAGGSSTEARVVLTEAVDEAGSKGSTVLQDAARTLLAGVTP